MKDTPFLTTAEVMAYLHVNLRTVYRLIRAGQLPAVRVGRQWRFRKSDIDAWLQSERSGLKVPPAIPTTGEHPRVLVVDDEPSIRKLLAKILALAEYDVDEAPTGWEALDRMRDHGYHLLIADITMPGMDGLSLIKEARRLGATLPVVAITGHSTEATAIEAANLGVWGYFTKPFKAAKVLEAAARALGE